VFISARGGEGLKYFVIETNKIENQIYVQMKKNRDMFFHLDINK